MDRAIIGTYGDGPYVSYVHGKWHLYWDDGEHLMVIGDDCNLICDALGWKNYWHPRYRELGVEILERAGEEMVAWAVLRQL